MTAQADFRELSPVSQTSALWGVADVQSSDFGDNQMTAHGRLPSDDERELFDCYRQTPSGSEGPFFRLGKAVPA